MDSHLGLREFGQTAVVFVGQGSLLTLADAQAWPLWTQTFTS
jgi:hypothetical protein